MEVDSSNNDISVNSDAEDNDSAEWQDVFNEEGYGDAEKDNDKQEASEENENEKAPNDEEKKERTEEVEEKNETTEEIEEATDEKSEPKNVDDNFDQKSYIRQQRLAQKTITQEQHDLREDIRKELFSGVANELTDADGDPIKSIEDIAGKLINPETNEAFTEDEAAMWILNQSQMLKDNKDRVEAELDSLVDTNITLKDESEEIMEAYGDFISENPDIADMIWEQYSQTLVKDPETDIILKAPVSLSSFYSVALKPYIALSKQLQEQEAAQNKEVVKNTQSERADIMGHNNTNDNLSQEDKEWQDIYSEYYNN